MSRLDRLYAQGLTMTVQPDLFVTVRDTAVSHYRRVKAWERTASDRLRRSILVPYFGGCLCRMHNCQINYEGGRHESAVNGLNHRQLAKLAKRYDHEQRIIWDTGKRLADHFARGF